MHASVGLLVPSSLSRVDSRFMGLGTLPYQSPQPPTPSPGGGPKGASGPGRGAPLGPQGPAPSRPDPTAPYSGGQVYPRSAASTQNSIIDQFNAINQARMDALDTQYLNSLGMAQVGFDNNMWYKQAGADNDLARLALQEGRDIGLGRERNLADRGFAQRGFDIDSTSNALTRDMRYRANTSEAAGRGSITSFGYGQNERDILGQFNTAQDTTQLQFDKKTSDLDINSKEIDSLASEYGIRKSDVMNALRFGTTQLGLDWEQTKQQLANDLESGNSALQQQALNFMQQIMSLPGEAPTLADVYPNGLPSATGNGTGVGGVTGVVGSPFHRALPTRNAGPR